MRTLDIGGDKDLPYFPIDEENPFLGWRGIRISLDHPEIFLVQIRALLRASEGLNNLRIMLPMISNIPELDDALELVKRAHKELVEEEGYNIQMPPVGAMIEVPAAVYQVAEIGQRVDFLSIGTNDLIQYLLAVDRNNPRVAELYDAFHPSVLRALKVIFEQAASVKCQLSVCGEMAASPEGAVLLFGLGYENLSMSATALLKVKSTLLSTSRRKARDLARRALEMSDAASVSEYVTQSLEKS
jgi:phosphotransferase system enzyme I (PtsP)